ncbi:hypothetical protein PDE_09346 [Penicillium oxalicum 114-2]|uniref:Uncharacterized protein n=1 Tax=Penicillium oxalicum (strain 114-2 / CGMCC 5302) TaxID=933388 RepID=S8BGZ4_PENO1|nr:hypothetical protein PDE_09346 [Penicillium oxalicum 114-2]
MATVLGVDHPRDCLVQLSPPVTLVTPRQLLYIPHFNLSVPPSVHISYFAFRSSPCSFLVYGSPPLPPLLVPLISHRPLPQLFFPCSFPSSAPRHPRIGDTSAIAIPVLKASQPISPTSERVASSAPSTPFPVILSLDFPIALRNCKGSSLRLVQEVPSQVSPASLHSAQTISCLSLASPTTPLKRIIYTLPSRNLAPVSFDDRLTDQE